MNRCRDHSSGQALLEALESRRLFSAVPMGLSATFYSSPDLTSPVTTRVDPAIHFNFGRKAPAAGLSDDAFSARWTGTITPRRTGLYTFITKADDGVQLQVNDQSIVNDWAGPVHAKNRGSIFLQAEQTYRIELDYRHESGASHVALLWSRQGNAPSVVPRKVLSPAPPTGQTPPVNSGTPGNTGDPNVPITPPPYAPPPPALVSGKVYTVDPNGMYPTIASAVRLARPGDTVLITPGVYHESIKLTTSGTAGQPITLEALTPGAVVMDAAGFKSAISSNSGLTSYITLKDITVKNCSNGAAADTGAISTGNGWTLQDVTVDTVDGTGIDVWGSGITLLHVTVNNCQRIGISGSHCSNVLVKDCTITGTDANLKDPGDNQGAAKFMYTDHVTVDGLNCHDNIGMGLSFDTDNTNVTVVNSTFQGNKGRAHDYEDVGLSMECDLGPVDVENNTFDANSGADISVASCRYVTIKGNILNSSGLDIHDYPRGQQYTDLAIHVTGNTFNHAKVYFTGGTWNLNAAATKQITFTGDTYNNSPAGLFTWGDVEYTLDQAKATLGLETAH